MKIANKLRNNIFILLALGLLVFISFKVLNTIKNQQPVASKTFSLSGDKVIIYTKNNCKYCKMAIDVLEESNIYYETIDLSFDLDLQRKLINQTQQTTVPYIFINDKFIGGYSQLLELKEKKNL